MKVFNWDLQIGEVRMQFRPIILLLHHPVQPQPPSTPVRLVLISYLLKTIYQQNDIFPVETIMKNIWIIGRMGIIFFLEMTTQSSFILKQGILRVFISMTGNLKTRKAFGHEMGGQAGQGKIS